MRFDRACDVCRPESVGRLRPSDAARRGLRVRTGDVGPGGSDFCVLGGLLGGLLGGVSFGVAVGGVVGRLVERGDALNVRRSHR